MNSGRDIVKALLYSFAKGKTFKGTVYSEPYATTFIIVNYLLQCTIFLVMFDVPKTQF